MKNFTLVFVAALSLAAFGCKKKGADCDSAIARSMELSKADMQKMPGMDAKSLDKLRDIGLQHCKDDKWPDAVLKCMNDAKTEKDAQACYGKLSSDQQEKMNKAMMEAMSPPGGAGSAAPAPAPTGSDTGSAGSAAPAEGSAGSGSAAGSAEPPK